MILAVLLFSAILGSFANMLIHRLPRDLDTVKRRSFCPKCEHVLGVIDLIPLLSYLSTLGRCRYCKQAISFRYFFVEVFSVASAVTLLFIYGLTAFSLTAWVLLWVGLILIFIDMEFQLLPDELTLGFTAFALGMAFYQGHGVHSLVTALGAAAGLFVLAWTASKLLKQDAMGGGDIKWALAMGTVLGFPKILVGMFWGFMAGAFMAIVAMIFFKKGRRDAIPFGPALIVGTWIAYFFGDLIWAWYWHG